MTVDVLIPVYKPDRRFARLLQMLKKQTVVPDRIIIMNTEKAYWNAEGYRDIPGMEEGTGGRDGGGVLCKAASGKGLPYH